MDARIPIFGEIRDELRRVTQNEMLCDWDAV